MVGVCCWTGPSPGADSKWLTRAGCRGAREGPGKLSFMLFQTQKQGQGPKLLIQSPYF